MSNELFENKHQKMMMQGEAPEGGDGKELMMMNQERKHGR